MSTQSDDTSIPVPSQGGRRRWVKVDVDDELFARLHIHAAESRMRILAYLRRCLSDARPYQPQNQDELGEAA